MVLCALVKDKYCCGCKGGPYLNGEKHSYPDPRWHNPPSTRSQRKQSSLDCGRSYPVYLALGDASDAGIEVHVLLPCQQVIQSVHLGTVTDVDALVTAVNDVNHPPESTYADRDLKECKRLKGSYALRIWFWIIQAGDMRKVYFTFKKCISRA